MNIRKIRKQHGMRQDDFWRRVGVTQSGGSRYETGRSMPKPVQMLVAIAYGTDRQRQAALRRLGR